MESEITEKRKMDKSFERLKAWQLGRKFRHDIYQISKRFPNEEKFHLTAQIRDAACSITANIAEGYGRYHYQENMQFCRIARGSVNEVLDRLYAAWDEKYISQEDFDRLYKQGREVERAINGYIGFLERELKKHK